MKKILLAIMGLIGLTGLVSCEKENTHSGDNQNRDIFYTVTEETGFFSFSGSTAHLTTEAEWDALLDKFCDYTQEGMQVIFCGEKSTQTKGSSTGKPNTISTSSREELKVWMREKEKEGKTVNVTYNSETGLWNGTAYANIGSLETTAAPETYNGVIALVATPVVQTPPLDGVVMAIRIDDETYIITLQGMMMWLGNNDPDGFMAFIDGSEATITGVKTEHIDINGNTFKAIELAASESGVIEF